MEEQRSVNGADTIPHEDTQAMAAAAASEGEEHTLQDTAFSLPVKYNKQAYHLSLDEATLYAQKGMKYAQLEPTLTQLSQLARGQGRSLTSYLQSLCDTPSPDLNERLAEEFCRLRERCPEVDAFDRLPESVVQEAVENGTPLLYAYLAYHHDQARRVTRAKADAAMARDASAGSQQGEVLANDDPTVSAMIRGVRGA